MSHCPQCGAEFSGDLCPSCLLKLGMSGVVSPPPPAAPSRLPWIVAAAILLLLALGWFFLRRRSPPEEARIIRFEVAPPQGTVLSGRVAVSPDGSRLAFPARGPDGTKRLWIRPLDAPAAQTLPGTEGGASPFWSPDSRFVAFFAQGKLKRIDAAGLGQSDVPQTICAAPGARDGTWSREGVILFASKYFGPIFRVQASGGEPTRVSALIGARPSFLPNDRSFLYSARDGVYAASLASQETKLLVRTNSGAAYASRRLFFVRDTTLMAQPFDAFRFQFVGEAVPVAEQASQSFSVSDNGVLAWWSDTPRRLQLTWADRTGRIVGSPGTPDDYQDAALSPDETTVALSRQKSDLWLLDWRRGALSRFTFDPAADRHPVWAPDGRRIVFFSSRDGDGSLYQKVVGDAGKEELLFKSNERIRPTSWSPDGRFLLYTARGKKGDSDLWVLPLTGDRKPWPLLQTAFHEKDAQVSPDARWVAYVSDESARDEVYVLSFPPGGGKWQISTAGGSRPRWRRDGRELFYVAPDRKLMAVAGKTGIPKELFQMPVGSSYVARADGQLFLLLAPVEGALRATFHVLVRTKSPAREAGPP